MTKLVVIICLYANVNYNYIIASEYKQIWQLTKTPQLNTESPDKVAERKAKVSILREGPIVMSFWKDHPFLRIEHPRTIVTLLNWGAQGIILPFQITKDGVVIVAANTTVEDVLNVPGKWEDYSIQELLEIESRKFFGRDLFYGPFTLIEVLNSARQDLYFLWPICNTIEIEKAVIELIDKTDTWDLILGWNGSMGKQLALERKLKPLPILGRYYLGEKGIFSPNLIHLEGNVGILSTDHPTTAAIAARVFPSKARSVEITYTIKTTNLLVESSPAPDSMYWKMRRHVKDISTPELVRLIKTYASGVENVSNNKRIEMDLALFAACCNELVFREYKNSDCKILFRRIGEMPLTAQGKWPTLSIFSIRALQQLGDKEDGKWAAQLLRQFFTGNFVITDNELQIWLEDLIVLASQYGGLSFNEILSWIELPKLPSSVKGAIAACGVKIARDYRSLERMLDLQHPTVQLVALSEMHLTRRLIDQAALLAKCPWILKWEGQKQMLKNFN